MKLSKRFPIAATLSATILLLATAAYAQNDQGDNASQAPAATGTIALPAPSVTHGTLVVNGRNWRYTATAGALPASANTPQRIGDIFYVAYTLDGADAARRPVTFVFNGGPGAASAYLHLGAMGPKRVALNDDGTLPPPPGHLVVNESSWLPFTDMVFVDPVGTGYSRIATQKKGRAKGDSSVWGVRRDLRTLGSFIRLYLARNSRWPSPKFIVGESYGGFRAAALPDVLEREFAIALNGTIMVSPVIEFGLAGLDGADAYRLTPWILRLPSYAATAWQHRMVPASRDGTQTADAFRQEAERFALSDYLTGLAGGIHDPKAFYDRLSHYTGLAADTLRRMDGRVSSASFAKLLLRGSGRIVSLYDASVAAPDPHPERPRFGSDPTFDPVTARIMDAFSTYVTADLGFKTDRAYRMLNRAVARDWDWLGGQHQGYAGTADALKAAMTRNPKLGAFIVHGVFDLVTPYFASRYIIDHMDLPESLRRNVKFAVYPGGHMLYTHAAARTALTRDAESFFNATLGRAATPPPAAAKP